MGEGTGEGKIRREDGDGKVRLGECQADQEVQRFHVRNRWIFLFIGWPHLVLTTILTTMPTILSGLISDVPSNFQAENASLNNWIALCRIDS